MQRGEFWKEVRKVREAWGIDPAGRVPETVDTNAYYPPHEWEQAGGEIQQFFRFIWLRQVHTLRDLMIPEVYRLAGSPVNWVRFLSACLLYDPPETDLLAFAACADHDSAAADVDKRVPYTGTERSSDTAALPIQQLQDPARARDDAHWYRDAIIDEIGKRFLEPRELDIREMYEAVIGSIRHDKGETQPLGHEYVDRQQANEPRPYIVVTEETTEEDVRKAFRAIKRSRGRSGQGGRPSRDRLVAIQCAILYDNHNSIDLADKRKRTWTFQSLAETFGLDSDDAAEGYVDFGREQIARKYTP